MARQLAIVIDLNKCMDCQTCTVACKVLWTDKKGMEHHVDEGQHDARPWLPQGLVHHGRRLR